MIAAPTIHPPEADLDLLRRYIDTGNTEAFSEIVRRYSGVVYSASRRILNDDGRAQDVAQETFYRLFRQPKLVTHSLGGWLHRSATHLAIDAKRSEMSRRHREKSYFLKTEVQGAEEPRWEDVSPHLDHAINALEEPARTLIVRHFLQNISQADLATELELSPATVSRRIKAGIDQLQIHLRKKGIYLGLAGLVMGLSARTAEAAPANFLVELAKMRLLGVVKMSAKPLPSPRGHYPTPAKLFAGNATRFGMLATAAGMAGLTVFFCLGVMSWEGHAGSAAPVHQPDPPPATVVHPYSP